MNKWRSITTNVDVETGEIIPETYRKENYKTIKTTKEVKYEYKYENRLRVTYGITVYTRHCRKIAKQGELFD